MAYENMTYERILQRMMDRVSLQYPNLDTREGSILFNALAPAAVELAIMYCELDRVLSESFVNTATREYILIACEQMGIDITQFEATYGTHKGVFDVPVVIGSRWSCELYNFAVTELIGQNESGHYEYKMVCETSGGAPNIQTGNLIAIDNLPNGLTYAYLVECLIEGEDESSDEEIRRSYFDYIRTSAVDGNIAQYERWCSEYDGIGKYKIKPLWNGRNTVKIYILSTANSVASDELIEEFQNYIDPGSTGMGDGVAPIGAIVTVDTATKQEVSIEASVTFKSGYSDPTPIKTALNDYFSQCAFERTTIPYLNIASVILNAEGVDSVSYLSVMGSQSDINLGETSIPVLTNLNINGVVI